MHNFDQIVCRFSSLLRGNRRRSHMTPDVILDHLRHQAVHGTPNGGNDLQNLSAADFSFKCAFDRLDLSLDAPDPADQLGLVFDGVRHGRNIGGYPILIKGRLDDTLVSKG
jgi:hypothetical protein